MRNRPEAGFPPAAGDVGGGREVAVTAIADASGARRPTLEALQVHAGPQWPPAEQVGAEGSGPGGPSRPGPAPPTRKGLALAEVPRDDYNPTHHRYPAAESPRRKAYYPPISASFTSSNMDPEGHPPYWSSRVANIHAQMLEVRKQLGAHLRFRFLHFLRNPTRSSM